MSAQTQSLTPKQTMLESVLAQLSGGAELAPLNIDQIDQCIQEYELALRASDAADAQLKSAKLGLIALVQQHGSVPSHAEQSKRIVGRRNQATITTATTMEIDEDAVGNLAEYLFHQRIPALFDRLFATTTKHSVIKGAKEVLAGVKLQVREHDRIASLFGLCILPKPKSPSLKVELIAAEKPERKPRAGKQVA